MGASFPATTQVKLSAYLPTNYYGPLGAQPVTSGGPVTTNQIWIYPYVVTQLITFSGVAINCTTGTSGNVQVGLYNDNVGKPGTLIDSTASMAITTPATLTANFAAGNRQLAPGLYWIGSNSDTANSFMGVSGTNAFGPWNIGSATLSHVFSAAAQVNGVSAAQTFGTWPTLVGATLSDLSSTRVPYIALLCASVP